MSGEAAGVDRRTMLLGGGAVVVSAAVFVVVHLLTAGLGEVGVLLAALGAAVAFGVSWYRFERTPGGDRPTPYSVLAAITAHTGVTPDGVPDLAQLTETIGRGLGARSCRLTVHRPGLRDRAHAWTAPQTPDGLPEVEVPIRYHDDGIGSLAVDDRSYDRARVGRDGNLVDDLAAGLGAVLAIGRHSIDLERQLRAARAHAEQIAQGRRAAVAEMDHERRTIESDLHDGVQGHLVSMRLGLGLVEQQITLGDLPRARERLPLLVDSLDTTENALANVSAGVSTLVLRDQGLVAALEADLGRAEPAIDLRCQGADRARRYPELAEQTVYFCCLEAVNNARKHAGGAAIVVELTADDDALRFAVRDQGPGFDTDVPHAGRGLSNLTARAAGAGGSLTIDSTPSSGTVVEGFVPIVHGVTVPDEAVAPPAVARVAAAPPPLATGPLERQVRGIAQAAAAACTEPPPPELEDLLTEFGHDGEAVDGHAANAREHARAALLRIDELLPTLPVALEHGLVLREQLERLRVGAHEVRELELLDALERGSVVLPGQDVDTVRRLLGIDGTSADVRLGLSPEVPRTRIDEAAHEQLTIWEGRAQHPTAHRSERWAAEILIRTCEDVLMSEE
ncbi:histidine kinase [Actinomycetospora endophytica]|uniref:Histidine kinase n=1 Tax=Actinomycetospora endophytica TaxID=2291215 RepID=A0ABS8PD52_9PSEU|nr:ATP-binding protein [Actinomycetospora endophytica]MCD2196186.1 histidine kinase [Actinomycetospora endophytica]